MTQTTKATTEALLTRYIVFESTDNGTTWVRLGTQDARASGDALRKFFKEPLTDRDGLFVAVSENAFKPHTVTARVKTTISPFDGTQTTLNDDENDASGNEEKYDPEAVDDARAPALAT